MSPTPAIRVTLRQDADNQRARTCLERAFAGRARIEAGQAPSPCEDLRLVSVEDADDGCILVGTPDLPQTVSLLAARSRLDHLVPPRAFDGGFLGEALERA